MIETAGPVVVRRSARRHRTVTAFRELGTIVVLLPLSMSEADERRYVAEMVAKVLAREARSKAPVGDEELLQRARELRDHYLATPSVDCPIPASVSWVTNQHHRWGSCTPSTGAIRLSERLRGTPDWVVDYVLLHELAHLVETDHSAAFRALVEVYPLTERAKGFLEGFLTGRGQPAGDVG